MTKEKKNQPEEPLEKRIKRGQAALRHNLLVLFKKLPDILDVQSQPFFLIAFIFF